jgi:hypothetical protein
VADRESTPAVDRDLVCRRGPGACLRMSRRSHQLLGRVMVMSMAPASAPGDSTARRTSNSPRSPTRCTRRVSCSTSPTAMRHRRDPAPVHRHGRTDRDLAGRCLPRLRRRPGDTRQPTARCTSRAPGRATGPLPGSRDRQGHRLRDQGGTGPHDDRTVLDAGHDVGWSPEMRSTAQLSCHEIQRLFITVVVHPGHYR